MEPRIQRTLTLPVVLFAAAFVFNGCYTSRQINNPREGVGEELEIVTISGRIFSFDSWSFDSLGTIYGMARFDRNKAYASIPSRDISLVRASHLDQGKAVLVVASVAATVYATIYVVSTLRELQGRLHSSIP